MTRMIAGVLLGLAMVSASFAQVSTHLYDANYTIQAYKLNAQQEAWFDNTDGLMSRFWYAWVVENLDLEKAVLNPDEHLSRGEEAIGSDDVLVNFRFAYSDAGIYILMEVNDNSYVDVPADAAKPYDYDGLELFGEQRDASTLYQQGEQAMPCISSNEDAHQLTKQYFQLQVNFGGASLIDEFSMNWWDPTKIDLDPSGGACWPGTKTGDGLIAYNRDISYAAAESQYNMKIEILPAEGAWRRQEWFIPWGIWGGGSGLGGVPTPSNKVAIAFGYNDMDPGQQEATSLRWRKADPYSQAGTGISYDAWGDLEFGVTLQSIMDAASCDWESCVPTPVIRDLSGITAHGKKIASVDFFTLSGKKLKAVDGKLVAPRSSLILKKITFEDKSSSTIKVPFSTVR